jgi:hypothetical protein
MRVNVYAEEMTDRIEIISKEIDGHTFTGLRFYLELPVTLNHKAVAGGAAGPTNTRGPFIHRPGDDDSSAVTFWGKRDLRSVLRSALAQLDAHYGKTDDSQAIEEKRRIASGTALDILDNLKGRSGFDGVWDECDVGVRAEIAIMISGFVTEAMRDAGLV